MFKCKFALVFLVVLAVYLNQSQGTTVHDKKDIKDVKLPVVATAAKLGVAKAVAAKIKLAAFKKWLAVKAIAKAPFILAKKAALLKIGAVKAITALKVAKTKKILGLASKKVAPAVAAVAAIPAAAVAALKPIAAIKPIVAKPIVPKPIVAKPVVDIFSVPASETHYEVVQPNAQFSSSIVSTYDVAENPSTFSNGYSVSLLPAGDVSSSYQYYSVPTVNQGSYAAIDVPIVPEVSEQHQATDTEVEVPHNNYGVPN